MGLKQIKVEMSAADGLEYLSFLQVAIEMSVNNTDTPIKMLKHNYIIKLQTQINNAIMSQCSIDDLQESINHLKS